MVSLRTSFWAGYFFQDLEIILTYVKCSVLRCSEGVYRFFFKIKFDGFKELFLALA